MNDKLTKKQRQDLRREHRQTRERRPADRIKAILLLDDGWTYEEIAEVLLLDDETIRRWENKFYPTFTAFKEACLTFFSTIGQCKPALRTLITENFQIIQTCNMR